MRTFTALLFILTVSCKYSAGDSIFSSLMESIVGDVESAVNAATADLLSRTPYEEINISDENTGGEVDNEEEDTNNEAEKDTNTAAEEQNVDSTTVKNDPIIQGVKVENAATVLPIVVTSSVPVTTVTTPSNDVTSNRTDTGVNKETVTEISNINNVTVTRNITPKTSIPSKVEVTTKAYTTTKAIISDKDKKSFKSSTIIKPIKKIRRKDLIDGPVARTPRNIVKISTTEKAVNRYSAVTDNPVNNVVTIDKNKDVITIPKGIEQEISQKPEATAKKAVTDIPAVTTNVVTASIISTTPNGITTEQVVADTYAVSTEVPLLNSTMDKNIADVNTVAATTDRTAITNTVKNQETTTSNDVNDIKSNILAANVVTTSEIENDNIAVTTSSLIASNDKNQGTTAATGDATKSTSRINQDDIVSTTDSTVVTTTAKNQETTTASVTINDINKTIAATLDNATTVSKVDQDDISVTTVSSIAITTAKLQETTLASFDNVVKSSEIDQGDISVTTDSAIVATTAKNQETSTASDTINNIKSTTIDATLDNATTASKVDQDDIYVTTDSSIAITTAKNQETTLGPFDNIEKFSKIDQGDISITTNSAIVATTAKNQETTTERDNINDIKSTILAATLDNATTTANQDNTAVTTDSSIAATTAKNQETTDITLVNVLTTFKPDHNIIANTTDSTVIATTAKNQETIAATLKDAITTAKIDQDDVVGTTDNTVYTSTAKNQEIPTENDNIKDFKFTPTTDILDNIATTTKIDVTGSSIVTRNVKNQERLLTPFDNVEKSSKIFQDQAVTTDSIAASTAKNQETTTTSDNINDFITTTISSVLGNVITTFKVDQDNVTVPTDSSIPTTTAKNQATTGVTLDNVLTTSKADQNNLADITDRTVMATTATYKDDVITTPVAIQDQTTKNVPIEQPTTTKPLNNEAFTTPLPTVTQKDVVLDKSNNENTTSNPIKVDMASNSNPDTPKYQSTTISIHANNLQADKDSITDQNTMQVTTSGPYSMTNAGSIGGPTNELTKEQIMNTRRMFIDNTAFETPKSDSTTIRANNVTYNPTTVIDKSQETTTISHDLTTEVYQTTKSNDVVTTTAPIDLSANVLENTAYPDLKAVPKRKDLPTTRYQQLNGLDSLNTSYVTSTISNDVYMAHPTIGLENFIPTTDIESTTRVPTPADEATSDKQFTMFGNIIPIGTTTPAVPTTNTYEETTRHNISATTVPDYQTTTEVLPISNIIPPPMAVFGTDFNGQPTSIVEREPKSEPVIVQISNNIFEIRNSQPTTVIPVVDEIDKTKRYNPKILLGRDFSEATTPSTLSTTEVQSTTKKKPNDYNLNIIVKYLKPKRLNDNKV